MFNNSLLLVLGGKPRMRVLVRDGGAQDDFYAYVYASPEKKVICKQGSEVYLDASVGDVIRAEYVNSYTPDNFVVLTKSSNISNCGEVLALQRDSFIEFGELYG